MSKNTEFEKFVNKAIFPRLKQQGKMDLEIMEAYFGLMAEVGELMEHTQKLFRDGIQVSHEDGVSELGDILHYLTRIIIYQGLTLNEVMDANITKIKKRKNL